MEAQAFAYWLQGFAELNGHKAPDQKQWTMIVAHLETVFKKETPQKQPTMPMDNNVRIC